MKNILQCSKDGVPTFGIYISIDSPVIVEMAAAAGFDFVRIDCEHAMVNLETVAAMIRAADACGIAVQVRVSDLSCITKLLDFGVSGIVVPNVSTKEDAERAVREVKYAPVGMRGMASPVRRFSYGKESLTEYLPYGNDEMCLIVQIEGEEGLKNLEEILTVEGVDMVSSGKMDLSQALHVPGEITHPKVIEAEDYILETAMKCGKQATLLVGSAERAKAMLERGVTSMTIAYDTSFFYKGLKAHVERYRDLKEK